MFPFASDRRQFLRAAVLAGAGSVVGAASRCAGGKPAATADAVILLWMAGGQAAIETWDMKAYTPFVPGMEAKALASTFRSVPTTVDGLRISEGLPRVSRVMHLGTLVKSFAADDLGRILHTRHQFQWHTGYVPPTPVPAPHIGAVVARTLGPRNGAPPFVEIGQRPGRGEDFELRAFRTAGFLGAGWGPFVVPEAAAAVAAVRPPAGMSRERFLRRHAAHIKAAQAARAGAALDPQAEGFLRAVEGAHRLMASPAADAFDLNLEPKASRDAYGTDRFGLGCLLARRLVEAGSRFVEVTTEYAPFQGWDTHESGHQRAAEMMSAIDAPIARLVLDLEERGLLSRTLVVIASEFTRDAIVEGDTAQPDRVDLRLTDEKLYGHHQHQIDAGAVVLFGGGVKRGHVHGATTDERPFKTVKDRVNIRDLHATIYHTLGIPADLAYDVDGRPFHVTEDGKGKPILGLLG